MSVDINLAEPNGPENQHPDRLTGILALLLAVLLLVAAVSLALVSRGRMQQAALLKPTPTATHRVAATAVAKATNTLPSGAALPKVTGTAPAAAAATQTTASGATKPLTTSAPATGTAKPVTGQPSTAPTLAAGATRPAGSTTPGPAMTLVPGAATAQAGATQAAPKATGTLGAAASQTPAAPAATGTALPGAVRSGAVVWFAEGASVTPFRTSYAIFNPGAQAAAVTFTLYPEDGKTTQKTLTVGPGAQVRVLANEMLPNSVFGAGISSDMPVYVERVTLGDRDGTSGSAGTPALTWYFPEVQTDADFTTWLTVVNPGAVAANITVTYMPIGAKSVRKTYTAPAGSRLTIAAQADVPVGVMGAVLESDQPVMAEHSLYFDDQKAAYGGAGVPSLSKSWYIAGANTQDGYVSRLALLNPNKEAAKIKVTYLGSKQPAKTDTFTIQGLDKDDIVVNDQADGQIVSMILEADRPLAAELVTYFQSDGESGPVAAYAAPALDAPVPVWYVPETVTGPLYESYLNIFNPGDAPASVTVSYVIDGGSAVASSVTVGPKGTLNLKVSDEVKGKSALAASVKSNQPVVVSRVTMFKTLVGATSSAGIRER